MFTKSRIRAQVIARLAIFLCQLGSVSPALAVTADVGLCRRLPATPSVARVAEPRLPVHVAQLHVLGVGY